MAELSIEGKIVNPEGSFFGRIEISEESGLINQLDDVKGKADLDVDSALIFPGFVDVHVHAREDVTRQEVYKEDFQTASRAALAGGVVHFAEMPNNPRPPGTDEVWREKQKLLKGLPVGVTLYAAIGPQTRPLSFPVPYKVYFGRSVGNLFFSSLPELEKTLGFYEGQNISFHCEDPEILEKNRHRTTHEGRRPPEAEHQAITAVLGLIKKYGIEGKICHLSTRVGLELVGKAKDQGIEVTCEVSPHHLYFDETMLTAKNRLWLQVNPPLRSPEDRFALLAGLREGTIDYLASDHAPHTKEEKGRGLSGLPHLDTYGLFVTWLLQEERIKPETIAKVCALNPGNFLQPFLPSMAGLGLGRIAPNYEGSLTILDLENSVQVESGALQTKCGWSPFEGKKFPGRVWYTVVKGRIHQNNL